MNARIRRIREAVAYEDGDNPWVKVYFDWVEFPDGHVGRYNRVVESEGRCGVAILPIRDGLVGLVRQYRYPIEESVWEIPRGFGESDPASDAARELREEMGLRADDLIELGFVYPNSGILSSKVCLFAAVAVADVQDASIQNSEIEAVAWVPCEEVLARISSGEISDAITIAAVSRARQRGLL